MVFAASVSSPTKFQLEERSGWLDGSRKWKKRRDRYMQEMEEEKG